MSCVLNTAWVNPARGDHIFLDAAPCTGLSKFMQQKAV